MKLSRLPYKIKRAVEIYGRYYLLGHTPVLVYCTGRVGSIALFNALYKRGVFAFKVEDLNPNADRRQRGTTHWVYSHVAKPRRPAKVIFIVRNPVALMVSDFLPKLPYMTDAPDPYETLTPAQMRHIFNTKYFQEGRHLEKLRWFQQQAEPYLGVDVYAQSFPQQQGYLRFRQAGYDALVIRTELDNPTKARVVGDFVGLDDLRIERMNVGEKKDYGDAYGPFKRALTIKPEHLETIFASQYARHFYGRAKMVEMNERWLPQPMRP